MKKKTYYVQFDGVDIGEVKASNKKEAMRKAILKYKNLFWVFTKEELKD